MSDGSNRRLPEGWRIESLGIRDTQRFYPKGQPNEKTIDRADYIVVSYTAPNGEVFYRTIHGAPDYGTLSDLINNVTKVVSPTGIIGVGNV